jgi:tRNA G18 (ribose-2'-O)-methylase SpoU
MQDNIQLTHEDHIESDRKFRLSIIVNDMSSPLNVGSLFRLCDALGIENLYLCGNTATPPNSKINKTSRSTQRHVNYEIHENAERLTTSLKESGALVISLEITNTSIDIGSEEFRTMVAEKISSKDVICLILGSENKGISEKLLSLSDMTTHIPMYGHNSSMNVISAASIACFEIIRLALY